MSIVHLSLINPDVLGRVVVTLKNIEWAHVEMSRVQKETLFRVFANENNKQLEFLDLENTIIWNIDADILARVVVK